MKTRVNANGGFRELRLAGYWHALGFQRPESRARFGTAAAALAAVLVCQSASAQGACDRRERVLGLLADKYQETPVAVGVTTQGSLVEVLSDDTGKTWTIVITSPQGISCLLLTGEGWKKLLQVAQDPEA